MVRGWVPSLVAGGLGLGCGGPEVVFRAVEVDVQGVNPAVAALEVRFVAGGGVDCRDVRVDNVTTFSPTFSARWTSARSDRSLSLPRTDAGEGTLLVFTEDADGAVLQVACQQLDYASVESPEVVVRLSAAE